MVKLLSLIIELLQRRRKKPWARFTVDGISPEGQVKFDMAYNKAFIKNLTQQGLGGASDEETVQNFLFGCMMYPSEFENQEIASDEHPFLRSEANTFKS